MSQEGDPSCALRVHLFRIIPRLLVVVTWKAVDTLRPYPPQSYCAPSVGSQGFILLGVKSVLGTGQRMDVLAVPPEGVTPTYYGSVAGL